MENRLMDMGRGEERVRCMERITWKLTLPYIKLIANRNLLSGSGNSNKGSAHGNLGNFYHSEITMGTNVVICG